MIIIIIKNASHGSLSHFEFDTWSLSFELTFTFIFNVLIPLQTSRLVNSINIIWITTEVAQHSWYHMYSAPVYLTNIRAISIALTGAQYLVPQSSVQSFLEQSILNMRLIFFLLISLNPQVSWHPDTVFHVRPYIPKWSRWHWNSLASNFNFTNQYDILVERAYEHNQTFWVLPSCCTWSEYSIKNISSERANQESDSNEYLRPLKTSPGSIRTLLNALLYSFLIALHIN